jgi:hypothetical protein
MPTFYEIRVEAQLEPSGYEWLEGMTITWSDTGGTLLSGPIADQAALHGLLGRIRDLNLTLVLVEKKEER